MKSARQEMILRLLREQRIETQEELAALLGQRGFAVTQATISRDIRELRLTKHADENGRVFYRSGENREEESGSREKYLRVLQDAVVSADLAGNLVVVKTSSGMAMAAAVALEELDWKEILGCIAGDNTIFCAVRNETEGKKALGRLRAVAPGGITQ